MQDDATPPHWMQRMVEGVNARLPFILGVLTVTGFLSGLAYFKGFFGSLGLEALVFSLPFEMYLAAGGISVIVILLAVAVLLFGILAIGARFKPDLLRERKPTPGTGKPTPPRLMLVAASALLWLAIVFILPWTWLAPVASILPFPIPEWITLPFLLLLGLLMGPAHLVVLRNLQGPPLMAYGIAFILMSGPALAHAAGNHRAEHLFDNVDSRSRALVWWTDNATEPSGYVVVHQDGSLAYLVAQVVHDAEGRAFHSTVVDVGSVPRIVFIPPGADVARAYPGSASPG